MSEDGAALRSIRRFESDVAEIREGPEPRAAQMTVRALAAMAVAIFVVTAVARVDRVVTSTAGKIVGVSPPILFQALDTSLVKTIDVREGDAVVKGQRLATLDPTFAQADVKQLEQLIASLDAQIARARAEQDGVAAPGPDATAAGDLGRYRNLQFGLFTQRQAQYRSQLRSFDEKIDQVGATLKKLQGDVGRLQEREQIARKIEDMRTQLLKTGAGSLLNQLLSADQRLELARSAEGQQNAINEAKHQLQSLRADRESYVQQWSSELSKELVTALSQRDQAAASLEKAARRQELVELVAPSDGYVLSVAKLSVGSVLQAGMPFITVTPAEKPLEAEIRIASRDIGFVRAQDHASLKFEAFDFVRHGTAEGRVLWISDGAFGTDETTGQPVDPYYRARISIDEKRFINVPDNFRLIPGMVLTADIKVGSRTLAEFLLQGLFVTIGTAMREP